jgi:hypothetical protein
MGIQNFFKLLFLIELCVCLNVFSLNNLGHIGDAQWFWLQLH